MDKVFYNVEKDPQPAIQYIIENGYRMKQGLLNALYAKFKLKLSEKDKKFKSNYNKRIELIAYLNSIGDDKAKFVNDYIDEHKGDIQRQPIELVDHKRIDKNAIIKKGKLISRDIIDKIGPILGRNKYTYEGIEDNRGLFEAIREQVADNMLEYEKLPNNITVLFKQKDRNKITARTLVGFNFNLRNPNEDLYTTFNRSIAELMVYSVAGSDPIGLGEEDYDLVLDTFILSYYGYRGSGKSDGIIWECEGIESKNNLCGYECLKKLGYEYEGNPRHLQNLETLIKYIDDNDLPINVVSNSVDINISKMPAERIRIGNRPLVACDVKHSNIDCMINFPVFIYAPGIVSYKQEKEEERKERVVKHIIIYDYANSHFDIASKTQTKLWNGNSVRIPILKDNIKISTCGRIIKDNIIVSEMQKVNTKIKKIVFDKHLTKTYYLFFDYETVIDMKKSHCMQEYSLSINYCGIEHLKEYEEADIKKDIKALTELRKNHCITFKGYDCSEQFIKWLIKMQRDSIFILVGYNNANFDNLILLNALLNYRINHPDEITIKDEQYNGNQLLNFTINGRHRLFDLRKHLTMGNLAGLCKAFNLNLAAKKKFDHSTAQRMYNDDPQKLLDFINNNEELQEYNEFDVISIAVIYFKYRKALQEINICEKYAEKLYETPTIGSLIWKIFKDNQEKEKLEFPKLKYQHYKDILKYKIAGRVEMFNGIKELFERICSMDVCSLYPYMMAVAPNYYPTGDEIFEIDFYAGDDELGFYYCDFDQSELRAKNLPNIYAEKLPLENNWNHTGEVKGYLISNVMIRLLKKFNCKITIHNGFIFKNYEKGFKIFKFLAEFMQAKNAQDKYKADKDPNYNGVLREVMKLAINSLSGKVIEGIHNEKVKAINNESEYFKIKKSAEKINFINAIGDRVYCSYTLSEEDLLMQQRPVYLGVLIYDYSKEFMYTHAYSKIGLKNLVYTDTDSCKFPYQYLDEWKKYASNVIVPHWSEIEEYDPRYRTHKLFEPNSKVFGSYEDEYADKEANDYYFVCVEKKSYLYKAGDKMDFKFKGISPNSIPLLGDEEILTKNKKGELELIDDYLKVYEFYENNKNDDKKRFLNFFKQIFTNKKAIILTSSFRRIVKNGLRDVALNDESRANSLMNHVQVNFAIKQINLNRKKEEEEKKAARINK